MPRRTDIRSILLIGSGPIVIGQACEFDYSGTQACKALREEGYRVILVNSNPATIMTDPEFADRTYIEPMTVEVLERIIAVEKPDALLPTIGGQTGLNLALDLAAAGVLERHGVELIGAKVDAIRRAEDRDLFKTTMASIGVDTGGSNIQFAVHPQTGRLVVIEMNPRVSRSSALASKATGFPIAKIAAKLAVGYTLDEIPNDITRETPACFEPTIDYVVTKIPRFTFEKFPQATDDLGPQMKSVGEAMAIGRTFKESLQKAMRSLEIGSSGFEPREGEVTERLRVPNADRLWYIGEAFRRGMTVDEVAGLTAIDPWFLRHIDEIIAEERALAAVKALAPERPRAP